MRSSCVCAGPAPVLRPQMRDLVRGWIDLLAGTGRELAGWPRRSRCWTAGGWLWRALVLAAIGLALWQKRALQPWIQGRGDALAREMASLIGAYADGAGMIALGVAAYLASLLFRWPRLRACAQVFLAAGLWCLIFWTMGKFIFAERRPLDGGDLRFFAEDGHGISGHASVAALLILPIRDVLLRDRTPRARGWITAAAALWVCLVCWSRVFLGMHFVWNVLSGGSLGLWVSGAAVAAWAKREDRIGPT